MIFEGGNERQKQQGDVTYERVDTLPSGLKPVKARSGSFILADGEVTGHAHRIDECPEVDLFEDENGTLFMSVKKDVALTHEEHGTHTVKPGAYKIGRVKEVDPFTEEIDEVRD